MDTDFNPKARRKNASYTLDPSNITMINEIALEYKTSASRIVDTFISKYGAAVLKAAIERNQEESA